MNERNYHFGEMSERVTYEDELPDDMTDADYTEWFKQSWVDGVRMGPVPVPLHPSERTEP